MALTDIDRSLLKRCIADEPGAWRDFVDRFIGLFVHVVNHTAQSRSVRLPPDDIDDICSEIFLAILSNDYAILRRFRGKCSLATYLTVLARRIVVKEISQRRMAEAMGHVTAHHSSIDRARVASREPEDKRIENREEVERLLKLLPPMDASIVKQFHLEGRSYHEISLRLGIPENSIGPTLSRARARLKEQRERNLTP
ncbi:MAG: sigma-70 family RNA polymerase sigma factor [Planctomycetota bacterium]|nr:sigma-70 family RNA polymerase sigma factor [Planctomycetota bacterium]